MNPIGIIYDIKKFAVHDGPGIRTTVFLKGCPLSCWWCHNPESQSRFPESKTELLTKNNLKLFRGNETIGVEVSVEEVMREVEKDIVFFDESEGGVTFSGGEPLMQDEFLLSLLKQCRLKDIHTVVDTSGYADYSIFEKINDYVNIYLYDLKIYDNQKHLKYTGVSNQLIHQNLKQLLKAGKNVKIRLALIPGIVDSLENLAQIISFIKTLDDELTVDILPYNKIGENKYNRMNLVHQLSGLEQQTEAEINRVKLQFETAGLKAS